MTTMTRLRAVVLLLVGAVLISGCSFDIYKAPLPGGTSTGDNPVSLTVEFADVLDLVPQSSVKVNDVSVGKVTDVRLDGTTALVDVEIRGDVELPQNAVAEIRQTSLLGEKFVSLEAPADPSPQTLADGDLIPLERSGRNPEVEEVFGALSLVLNGGGIAQLRTIADELNQAFEGREGSAKSVLRQIDTLMGTLDQNKGDIVDAIESLNQLSISVNDQTDTIEAALDDLPSALRSIDSQRADLVKMLDALNELGDVGVEVIAASKEGTVKTLERLTPVLSQLAAADDDLAKSIHVFLTYPFVDEVVGRDPQAARNLHMGDYMNLSIQLDVDISEGLPSVPGLPTDIVCTPLAEIPDTGVLPNLSNLCEGALIAVQNCLQQQSVAACGGLPGAVLNNLCQGQLLAPLCGSGGILGGLVDGLNLSGSQAKAGKKQPKQPAVPALPALPDVGGLLGSAGGGSGGLLGNLLGGTGLLGAPRAAFGEVAPVDPVNGPTYGQLKEIYDPGLVSLMVPGMLGMQEAVR